MNRRALIKPAGVAFSYFGHKMRYIDRYPVPRYDHIIEPFAGGAGYALRYCDLKVTLYELDEKVCMLWDYLINASEADVLALPLLGVDQHIDELGLNGGAYQLVKRWINPQSGGLNNRFAPSSVKKFFKDGECFDSSLWSKKRRYKTSQIVKRIKHWKIINKSYIEAINTKATWFIDPPYASKVSKVYNHYEIDYDYLASFCRSRKGQTIVCENTGSPRWLPFRSLLEIKGGCNTDGKLKRSVEVLWCSDEQDYPMQQQSLL
jgi:hypothetical protein